MLIKLISEKSLIDEDFILDFANKQQVNYFKFQIEKRTGGMRTIYHPSKELKYIQKILLDDVISSLPIHNCCYAYVKNRNIHTHAIQHKNAKYLLRLDFRNFFESISYKDIYEFCETTMGIYNKGWTSSDSEIFSKLVCYKDRLTIGSVTSPSLSNAICYDLDIKLSQLALSKSVKYTRYADDMFFSTKIKGVLYALQNDINNIISTNTLPSKLKLNLEKTHHTSKKRKMAITGLVITNDGNISLGRRKKREIKSKIYKWDTLSTDERTYLSGYLAYIKSVEPEFINNLCDKYDANLILEIIKFNTK
ncbi:retron St85 family RNA-directed DNA polymerase [Photobacterium phosphoreum]|uniref:retron St85 family RNA-directed DNA polymerase n=2 Tax=Photobacterium phosphoreum TaxID=659 RepID=UPI0007F95B21|nr:retron St85 family RNA-directed DNA polymerase [Photobacterium phosphoreum]MCD9472566.1 RNA-directed DNA polymerase [Photobacterium phosphoreum]OBU47187.1 reverse transcriptase [Photobacterium phosphoreum]